MTRLATLARALYACTPWRRRAAQAAIRAAALREQCRRTVALSRAAAKPVARSWPFMVGPRG